MTAVDPTILTYLGLLCADTERGWDSGFEAFGSAWLLWIISILLLFRGSH